MFTCQKRSSRYKLTYIVPTTSGKNDCFNTKHKLIGSLSFPLLQLLLGRYPCPRYQEELDRVFGTAEVQSIIKSNKGLLEYASTQSGLTITTPDDAQSLYSTLRAEVII